MQQPELLAQTTLSQSAQRMYDDLAPRYDHHLLRECQYQTPHSAADLLSEYFPSAHGFWLELGAGTGLLGGELARAGIGVQLLALDLSRVMLAQIAHQESFEEGTSTPASPYVACCEADASLGLPFGANAFDGACAIGFFEHIVDPACILSELYRTLSSGAPLLFSFCIGSAAAPVELFEAASGLLCHSPDVFQRSWETAGFELIHARTIQGYESYGEPVNHQLTLLRRRD